MSENYRVYKVPKTLRQAAKADRLNREQRLADYLDDVVDKQLDRIVDGLNTLGIKALVNTGACRWPVSDKLLAKLRKASDKTGIAASPVICSSPASPKPHPAERQRRHRHCVPLLRK